MDLALLRHRWAKLRRQDRPLRFLASRLMWRAGISQLATVELDDGLRVRFYPSSVSAGLWVEPGARDDDAELLRAVLRPGDRYIDCGANIGHLALVARHAVGPTGSVLAIEANPRICGYCVGNLRLNGFDDVRTLNAALGEAAGAIAISDERADDTNHVGTGATTVAMVPLDAIAGAAPIALLKIDVEGYELHVLRGARDALARTTAVYCELSERNSARFDYHPRDVEALLLAAGFALTHFRDGEWRYGDRGVFDALGDGEAPATGYNLLAIRRSALPAMVERFARAGQRLVRAT